MKPKLFSRISSKLLIVILIVILILCSTTFFACVNNSYDLEYKVNSDGKTCTITGLGNYSSKNLVIPSKIGDYEVTAIADCAFQGTDITTFSGADTITTIGKYAFYNCKQLSTVLIPDSVIEIGEHCFEYCENLSVVNLPPNLKNIESHTFAYCSSLQTISLPEGIVEIGDAAFYLCMFLTSINIPDTTQIIGKCAFTTCVSLTNIVIPNSVTEIGDAAFSVCHSLTSIYFPASVISYETKSISLIGNNNLTSIDVDPANPVLSSIDGNLYANNATEFINYACGKTDSSFNIPNGVIKILGFSFGGCASLKVISIPQSVNYIGSQIFYTSSNIETIYYDGTIADWYWIVKNNNWNAGTESVFTIICTDGTIAMDGTVTYN